MSVHKQNRGGRAQNGDITSNDTNPLIAPIRAQQVSCFDRYGSPAQRCAAATLPVGHAQGLCAMFQGVRGGHLRGDWWRNERKGLPTFEDGWRSACIVDAVPASSTANG